MCLYLCDISASLSGVCLSQVMLSYGHSDDPGGLNRRGGSQHVSGGQDDSATHVATITCHRHKPGELTRLRGPEKVYLMHWNNKTKGLLAEKEFWISVVTRSKTEIGHRGQTSLLSPGQMTMAMAKPLFSLLNFLLDEPPQ